MMLDWTISIGNIIQLVALLGAALSVFYGLSYRLKAVEKEMEKLSNVLITLAVQTTEIAHLRKRIDDLSEVSRVNFEDYPPVMRRQKM
jgi:ABC-type nickel/cobalt efflux system permease component RcnA